MRVTRIHAAPGAYHPLHRVHQTRVGQHYHTAANLHRAAPTQFQGLKVSLIVPQLLLRTLFVLWLLLKYTERFGNRSYVAGSR